MPLHTGFHPTCAVAFCPIYDTARQNFASKVRRWGGGGGGGMIYCVIFSMLGRNKLIRKSLKN